ncbi:hypothetical protein Btru_011438 [Bulinus truncatus]|nr:hypothetical protein Btru_011438 [Bulinus truncatus]
MSGADPNICEASSGDSPLMLAVRKEIHRNDTNILLRFGADVNCLNIKKQSALMIACQLGRVEIVKVLVSKGAHLSLEWEIPVQIKEPANSEDGVCDTMDDGSHALRDIVVDGEKDTTHSPSQDHDVIYPKKLVTF